MVKRLEHIWKGLKSEASQISPIRPYPYGERFINFITGITMTREEAARKKSQSVGHSMDIATGNSRRNTDEVRQGSLDAETVNRAKSPVDKTLEKAQRQAEWSEHHGNHDLEPPERTLATVRSPTSGLEQRGGGGTGSSTAPTMTLPVVEEKDNEAASTGGRSGTSQQRQEPDLVNGPSSANTTATTDGGDTLDSSTWSDSPVDFRYDRGYGQQEDNSNFKAQKPGDNIDLDLKPLPEIPHLPPLRTSSIRRAVDPEKTNASDDIDTEGLSETNKQTSSWSNPLGRWGAS